MEDKYNNLADKYNVSARKYFQVLKLAIYHVDGQTLDSSYEVSQYVKSNEIYRVACDIMKALYKE